MLNEPDLQPNATINRWIQGILLFDFELIHVPADRHKGPDALSRRRPGTEEFIDDNDDSWLDNIALYQTIKSHSYNTQQVLNTENHKERLLYQIQHFLKTLETPEFNTIQQKRRFIQKATQYLLRGTTLFRKNKLGLPIKVIFDKSQRQRILLAAHEHLGHRGEFATIEHIRKRFFWPSLWNDVRHHVQSCHQCQIRNTIKIQRPITISSPSKLFYRIYLDCMYMPNAQGFRYIIAARDDLTGAAEGRALRALTAKAVARFFWEEILCRYGAVYEVITDNGPEVKKAFEKLAKRYHIPQTRISPYNSRANGVVERGHFTIRESLLKACNEHPEHWPDYVSHAFFADKVTTRKQTGHSPYYLLYGIDPLLPFDLTEASFLSNDFHSNMSTEELLTVRIKQLMKKPQDLHQAAETLRKHRLQSKAQFEQRFRQRLIREHYSPGTLVLVRHSAIEKELDRKSKPRYLGPYEIVRLRHNQTSYVLKELDGTVLQKSVAAFRIIPYISRTDHRLSLLTPKQDNKQDQAIQDTDNDSEQDSDSSSLASDLDTD